MDQKKNGHTEAYIKRQAKNIKKEQEIPYHKALEYAAVAAGFTNYKNFQKESKVPVKPKRLRIIPLHDIPSPSIIAFKTFGARKPVSRPNAKMALASHIELGNILKELHDAGDDYKRLKNAIGDVRSRLDDWVAAEYPDHNELPNEVFFNIYYGDQGTETEYSPNEDRRRELISLIQNAKTILGKNYHDCRPLQELYQKLDSAIKYINMWPEGRKPKGYRSRGQVPAGTLVLIKRNRKPAILIRHEVYKGVVVCYEDGGAMTCARDEVIVPKDQSPLATFKPMRLRLPYVKFSYPDGTELLVNRDYRPLWAKKDGSVFPVEADAIARHDGKTEAFFKDGSKPWNGNKQTLARCLAILEEWGVADLIPGPLALMPQAIAIGNTEVLRPENNDKLFPPNA